MNRKKYIILLISFALILIALLSSIISDNQPYTFNAAQELEHAKVIIHEKNKRTMLDDWEGFFWKKSKSKGQHNVRRGHYYFADEAKTLLRIVNVRQSQWQMTYQPGAMSETFELFLGYPVLHKDFSQPADYHVSVVSGEQPLYERKGKADENIKAVFAGDTAISQMPITIAIEFFGDRPQELFLNLQEIHDNILLQKIHNLPVKTKRLFLWFSQLAIFFAAGCMALTLIHHVFQPPVNSRALFWWYFGSFLFLMFCSFEKSLYQSVARHFIMQAQSLWHFVSYVTTESNIGGDFIWFHSKMFAPNPPFPSLLMFPFIPLFGDYLNDVIFTISIAAMNGILLFFVFMKLKELSYVTLTKNEIIWLIILFFIGSVHLTVSIIGHVWQTAHVVSVTCLILYILSSLENRAISAGFFLSAAMLTRPSMAVCALFFLGLQLLKVSDTRWYKKIFHYEVIVFSSVLLVGVATLLAYNYLRFHNWFDFGYQYLSYKNTREVGLFHTQFLLRNLRIMLVDFPSFKSSFPFIQFHALGMSIFLMSPAFIYLFSFKKRSSILLIAWLTAIVGIMPSLLYAETGWMQFGFRRLMDILPFLFVILALQLSELSRIFKMLVIISIIINLGGVLWLHEKEWKLPKAVTYSYR